MARLCVPKRTSHQALAPQVLESMTIRHVDSSLIGVPSVSLRVAM
jgi:hypothetical protein